MSQENFRNLALDSVEIQLKAALQSGIDALPKRSKKAHSALAEADPLIDSKPMVPIINDPLLVKIREKIGNCTRCPLHSGRTHIVFGEGNPKTELMFVGEAPGADEDLSGRPFVGRAGKLLTDMIEKGMGLKRENIYIANIVKCRPPGNRNPEPIEIENCIPFLQEQIQVIKPKVIIALGKFAAQTLLKTETPITKLRGSFHEREGIQVMPTYHPAYLLRNPPMKKAVWEDLQVVMKYLGIPLKKS